MKRIIRVFPRRTSCTPDDELVRVAEPPMFKDEADEVHISVSWVWDLKYAEELAKQWKCVAPVSIGGPATGMRGEEFVSGMYVKRGHVITSRGCNNKCWFCSVWKRDGTLRELGISEGFDILDDNLLSCSDGHVVQVFEMLERQKIGKPKFTGGLEAKLLKPWHVDWLRRLKPESMFFAYDTADDYEPLVEASRLLFDSGAFSRSTHAVRAYCMIGYPKDTFEDAKRRLLQCCELNIMPMSMLYMDQITGTVDAKWRKFHREWANPTIIGATLKRLKGGESDSPQCEFEF